MEDSARSTEKWNWLLKCSFGNVLEQLFGLIISMVRFFIELIERYELVFFMCRNFGDHLTEFNLF